MALRAAIARKKAEAEAKKEPLSAAPATSQALHSPSPQQRIPPDSTSKAAAAPSQPAAGRFEVKKGFLAQSAGILYPEGSSESALSGWGGASVCPSPLFKTNTYVDRYEVVGHFAAAGEYLGKEDFRVTRTGLSLEIRGNPQGNSQCLVAGLRETVQHLPCQKT